MAKNNFFLYGWFMVAVTWICYGFGVSPGYYSWGNFAPEIIADLDLDRESFGAIFGIFTFIFSFVGVLVGPAMARWSIRSVMVFGFVTSAIGFLYLSRADSFLDCIIGFCILGGIGIGFATILPCQTLGQNWFLKRRALAIAIILTAGGIVGKIVARFDVFIIENYTWRTGWLIISGVSAALAVFALIFIRDTPEQVGLHRDGATEEEEQATLDAMLKITEGAAGQDWTGAQAIKTKQFAFMVLCGIAYGVPWGIVVSHMRLHMQDIGYEAGVATSFVGTMALVSIFGRLLGGLGDHVPPQLILAVALVAEGIGCAGLLIAETKAVAYICIVLIGLGFGTAYTSIPVIFSHFFGRKAFGVTAGLRIAITGFFSGAGPWLTGRIFERTGAYTTPFIALLILCLIGATAAALLRHPGAPPTATK